MSEKDSNDLIDEELTAGRKVELILTIDAYEGKCLAVSVAGKEYFLAWETFEGFIPLEENEIRRQAEKEATK